MKNCPKCKQDKPLTDFYARSRSKDGRQSSCKECHDGAQSELIKTPKYMAFRRDYRRGVVERVNQYKAERGCACCDEKEPCALDLHHPDPSVKEIDPSASRSSWSRFLAEATKCIVVCANCHRKIHAGLIVC